MNIKKVFGSMLLGIGNILLFSILPLLIINLFIYILGQENIFNITGLAIFLISLVINVILVCKLYSKLFLNAKIKDSILYATLILIFWFLLLFVLMEFFGIFQPNGFISIGLILTFAYSINILFVIILNIIYMCKSDKDSKKNIILSIGIIIQITVPILYILFYNLISSGIFVKPYTEQEILNIFNKEKNINNSIILKMEDVNVNMDCNEGNGCSIDIGNNNFDIGDIVYLISDKGAKIYTIKVDNNYYKMATYVGSTGMIPTNQYIIFED